MPALLALLLAASPSPIKVGSLGLTPVGGLQRDLASFYAEHFAQKLGEAEDFEVLSPKAIGAVLGLERQRQLAGCAKASSSCLAELAGALGVQALIIGEAVALERSTQVDLRIIDASSGKVLFTATRRAKTREDLLDALDTVASEAAEKLRPLITPAVPVAQVPLAEAVGKIAPEPTPPSVEAAPRAALRWQPWAVVGSGAAVAIAAGVLIGLSASAWSQLNGSPSASLTPTSARSLASTGQTEQILGLALLGVGAAAIAGGLVWHFNEGEEAAPTAFAVPRGAGFGLAGHF